MEEYTITVPTSGQAVQALNPIVKGDTWNGVKFTFQDDQAQPIDLTGVLEVRVQFRSTPDPTCEAAVALSLTSPDNEIEVSNPAAGELTVNAVTPFNVPVTGYHYDVEITFADDTIKTYVMGTAQVTQDWSFTTTPSSSD